MEMGLKNMKISNYYIKDNFKMEKNMELGF